MKRMLLSIVLPVVLAAGLAPRADAGRACADARVWVSGYTRCGCPVYAERYVAYRDPWGRPVFATRTLPVRHACHARVRGHYAPGYGVHVKGPVLRPSVRYWTPPPRHCR